MTSVCTRYAQNQDNQSSGFGGRDSDSGSENDSETWGDGEDDEVEVDEDMHRKEEELQAELNLATKRCQELKETLQMTKSFIDGRGAVRPPMGGTKLNPVLNSDDDEDDDVDEEETYNYDDDEEEPWEEQSYSSQRNVPAAKPPIVRKQDSSAEVTPRLNVPHPITIDQKSYKNLQDAPSPSGRLGDRIVRLRQRCIQALGEDAFQTAYNFLKDCAETVSVH